MTNTRNNYSIADRKQMAFMRQISDAVNTAVAELPAGTHIDDYLDAVAMQVDYPFSLEPEIKAMIAAIV